SYQAAFASFKQAGYSQEVAIENMRNAIHIADQARHQFCDEHPNVHPWDIHIALLLGPFGSVISSMQDFGGIYPPYGPRAYSDSGENTISFDDDIACRNASIQALAHFHEDRLRIFTSNEGRWDKVNFIAFETVPPLREVNAIRQAMNNMKEIIGRKPWWITATFPDGKCQETRQPRGDNFMAEEIANAMLHSVDAMPVPSGIGINCTALKFLPGLLHNFERAMDGDKTVFLVLQPNGG
ncbi:hypothetical protein M405DRAFT_698759, partial [Rhizopogon salebrosus TDB-379]